jgi:hypothetical protein
MQFQQHDFSLSVSDVWINIVRVAECMGQFALVMCMVVAVCQDFYMRVKPSRNSKAVEGLAFAAGRLGVSHYQYLYTQAPGT